MRTVMNVMAAAVFVAGVGCDDDDTEPKDPVHWADAKFVGNTAYIPLDDGPDYDTAASNVMLGVDRFRVKYPDRVITSFTPHYWDRRLLGVFIVFQPLPFSCPEPAPCPDVDEYCRFDEPTEHTTY